MPPANIIVLVVGALLAVVLILIGFYLGRRHPKPLSTTDSDPATPVVNEDERQRMLNLLEGLSRWTSEYSDNVSDYQDNLQLYRQDIQRSLNGRDARNGTGDARMVTLLSQIMETNGQLQSRLEAAEKQLEEQTQQIESYLTEARTDGLTGLFNRRAFDKKLDELFAIYRGGGSAFVLVLIDIDRFKSINDNYGHPVGDVVLQRIASILGGGVAEALIVARFGGEEFAILMDLPIRIAAEKMNKVRQRIAEEPIPVGKDSLHVTLSVGISRPQDDLVIGPIVRRADEALYNAKKMGRNRIYFNDGNGPQLFGAPEVART